MSTVEERYRALANKLGEYVSLIQAGEEQYFTNLYEESLSYAFYATRRYIKNEEDCKDIVQEGFIKVFYNLKTLKDVNKYLPWMKRIMINLSINFLKERRPDLFLDYWEQEEDFYQSDVIPKTESTEVAMITDESRQVLEHLISLLSEKQATIIHLFYFDDLTIPEIATLLGIKEGTVKSRLFSARNNLKVATVAHEEKTGSKLYSFAALPLLFTNLDFANLFRAVGQGIQEEIWHGIAGNIQFPLSLEIAKQVGRIGRAGRVHPPAQSTPQGAQQTHNVPQRVQQAQGTPRGTQQFHRTPQRAQQAQGAPQGAQQTQSSLQGIQQAQAQPRSAQTPAQSSPVGQGSPNVSGQGFVRPNMGSVPHAAQSAGQVATKVGMSAAAKTILAVGVSVVVAGTGVAGFFLIKNRLDARKAPPSSPSIVSSGDERKVENTTMETTLPSEEETEVTQPEVSPWAQYTDVFKAKIAEVNANREELIRQNPEVDYMTLSNVGDVEWSIIDVGDNDEALPELFIRIPFSFIGTDNKEFELGLTFLYSFDGNQFVYVSQHYSERWGTFITDRENRMLSFEITTRDHPLYETFIISWSGGGPQADYLEPSSLPVYFMTADNGGAFTVFYKDTHNLNMALTSDEYMRAAFQDGSLMYFTTTTNGEHVGVLIDEESLEGLKPILRFINDPKFLVVQYAPFEEYETKVEEVLKEGGVGMLVTPEESDDLANLVRARNAVNFGKHENPK